MTAINFAGEEVALGPLRQELIPLFNQWNNDFVVNYTTRSMRPVTLAAEEDALAHFSNDKSMVFLSFMINQLCNQSDLGISARSLNKRQNLADMIYMDCLATEFDSPFMHAFFVGKGWQP